ESDPIKHAPGWKHENASDSEASVKADREPQPRNVEHLQRETVEHLRQNNAYTVDDLKNKAEAVGENISEQAKGYANKAKAAGESVAEQSKEYAQQAKKVVDENVSSKQAEEYTQKAKAAGEQASKEAQQAGEGVMEGVKAGAEKVTQFVKESVDTAKKAVGMDK
ncbi:hypothetical protein BGZ99_007042, partial [Dissophora globulifera]